jgi:hypothetical protein
MSSHFYNSQKISKADGSFLKKRRYCERMRWKEKFIFSLNGKKVFLFSKTELREKKESLV